MPKFIARGTIKLSGVVFLVDAVDIAEAKAKAEAGDWIDYEVDSASTDDWSINPKTVKLDE
jgi:hypothetical protein